MDVQLAELVAKLGYDWTIRPISILQKRGGMLDLKSSYMYQELMDGYNLVPRDSYKSSLNLFDCVRCDTTDETVTIGIALTCELSPNM